MTESDVPQENQREFFRVSFSPGNELQVVVEGTHYPIADISESGLRIRGLLPLGDDDSCSGELHWSDGTASSFTGKLIRREGNDTILCEVVGVPFQNILEEQRKQIRENRVPVKLKIFGRDTE